MSIRFTATAVGGLAALTLAACGATSNAGGSMMSHSPTPDAMMSATPDAMMGHTPTPDAMMDHTPTARP